VSGRLATSAHGTSAGPRPTLAATASASIRHPLSRALLTLTFTTGLVDAVSYLGLGHVFTANMTGNVVLLGFGIAGAAGLPIVSPLVSMLAFVVGAGAGGLLASKVAQRHPVHVGSALAIEVLLIAVAAVVAATAHPRPNAFSGDAVVALLALAMGLRNATVRRLAVPDLSTTVLTLTLTGLAADSRLAGGSGKGTVRRGSAVVAMLAGAIAGALMLKTSLALPLACAAALALITLSTYVPAARRHDEH
jgi:uncharacterized membrane protein YoaK (UPF0700 family)